MVGDLDPNTLTSTTTLRHGRRSALCVRKSGPSSAGAAQQLAGPSAMAIRIQHAGILIRMIVGAEWSRAHAGSVNGPVARRTVGTQLAGRADASPIAR